MATLTEQMRKHHEKHGKKESKKEHKREVHEMKIKRAENGGHVIEHHFESGESGEYEPPETHVTKKDHELMKHVKEHMCEGSTQEGAEGEA